MPRSLTSRTTWLVIAGLVFVFLTALAIDVELSSHFQPWQVGTFPDQGRAILTRGSWLVIAALAVFVGGKRA